VPDYDVGIAFFCGGLGFTLTEDIDQGRKRWVTVTPPGGGVRLVLARAEGSAQKCRHRASGGRLGLAVPANPGFRRRRRPDHRRRWPV
jgi:hypothetical protein